MVVVESQICVDESVPFSYDSAYPISIVRLLIASRNVYRENELFTSTTTMFYRH